MTMRFWIRNVFPRPVIHTIRKSPHRVPPSLELLEDRWLPSTFVVNNPTDSTVIGETDLREAIAMANATTGDNEITFDPTVFATPRTITLAGTQLELSNTSGTETITGPAAGVTVNAGGGSRVLQIDANVTASISGLTITGGKLANYSGGGVNNYGSLTMTNCTVSGNTASGEGGGVYSKGLSSTQVATLAMTNCTISNNQGTGGGGGVYNIFYSTTTLTDCIVTGNTTGHSFGGGVSNFAGTLTLANCTISDNYAYAGGGINTAGGPATMTDCTVSGNNASEIGGGVFNQGTTTMTNCTVSGNSAVSGGGMYNGSAPGYATTLTNCAINDNYASYSGGGLQNGLGSTVSLANCTVSGNSASKGGGLYNYAATTIPTLGNTIIAGNQATTRPDVSGGVTSLGNNLIGATDGSSGWVSSDLTGTSAAPLNALLAPLGNYGGLTQSMALLPGSPAIDAGNNALIPSGVTTDQRGLPRIVNGTVDIGAFESSGFTIAVTSGSDQATAVSTAFSAPLVVTITANNVSEPVAGGLLAFTPPASGASAILSASSAAISADGTASVTATANSTLGSYNVSATASGITTPASFSLTNQLLATFSDLTSPTIVYGTSTTTLSGHIGSGTTYPTGSSVSITLDSVTQTATVDANGNFSTTFTTTNLGVAGSPYSVTYVFAGNATFTTATDSSTTLTVTPATATVVVTPYTVTYDGTPHTATITSITGVNGETGATVGTVTLNTTHTNAATYSSDSWSFTGAGNYSNIASTTITDTITPATLTITANDDSKTYGTVKTFGTTAFTETGLATANGDTITGISETSTGAPASATAGSYPIVASAATGSGLSNYTIVYVNGTLTVNPANLTITANDDSKTYGTVKTFDTTAFTETGLVTANGDTITGVTETSTGALASAAAATYPIVASAATGSGLSNYSIVYVNGTLTVNPATSGTVVVSSANPSLFGQVVTFTATVTGGSGTFDNGGTVQFAVDGTNFGVPVSLAGGQAVTTDAALSAGSHTITATYSGDTNFNGSSAALAGGQTVQLVSGQISGTVFGDNNLNGQQDSGELGLAGQTVFLDLNNTGVFAAGDPTATTTANGAYSLNYTGLAPGTYTVRQVLLGGVLLSAPSSGSYSLTLGSQTSFTNQNFGDVLTSIGVPLTLPPSTAFPAQGNANADYVEAIYRAILDRNADAGGLTFWVGVLNNGSFSHLEVVQGIRNSPEHFTQEVDAFYQTLLSRVADAAGQAYWVGQLEKGLAEEKIAAAFLNSPEYLSLGDKHFVDAMYESLLGRSFDANGEAFWLSQLGDNTAGNPVQTPLLTHAQVVTDFLYSTESLERLVEGYYEVFLQRQADPSGLNFWVAELQQGLPFLTIGQEFVASDEFFARAAAHG